ncbi:ATP-binding protein [Chlorobaculum thiosulfatiphilum]|uniref:ATP-binding protein n=1 Tax=Chlorobaculum thiosulfatiphilum TaxID=115852 RepID=A0A5C4S6H5_CHLTI|nr:ATP-binding protein [Chlorobaculum thiosulfatiphilum]TNJ38778.1 ATP-binding protein [Chlorobaculum thiosulfatiphilum]
MTSFKPKSAVPNLLDLVAEGEGLRIEFKRLVHSAPKIARSITAFANTSGGVILIGVDDDRRIVGIHSEKETLEVIDEAMRFYIEPKPRIGVSFAEFRRRMVLFVDIPQSPERPHFHVERESRRDSGKRGVERRVFIRDGSHNKAASEECIALMLSSREPLKVSFTDRERRLLDWLNRHNRITAEEFADNAGIPMKESRRILVSLVRSGALRLDTVNGIGGYTLALR